MPSFMAKPSSKLPGCGGHMHQNLTDLQGNNVFYDEKDPDRMSGLFRHFLAGQMHCLPEILPMYCPNINSYKRLVEGYWAPTTPTWGIENRTVSFRVIAGGPKSTRVEVRVSGADMNAYLAIAASLASGMYGIEHRLPLIEKVGGNAYRQGDSSAVSTTTNVAKRRDHLPRNLWDASKRMEESKVARELFGETFVEHFVATRQWECRQFQNSVTNWEIERYLEII